MSVNWHVVVLAQIAVRAVVGLAVAGRLATFSFSAAITPFTGSIVADVLCVGVVRMPPLVPLGLWWGWLLCLAQ